MNNRNLILVIAVGILLVCFTFSIAIAGEASPPYAAEAESAEPVGIDPVREPRSEPDNLNEEDASQQNEVIPLVGIQAELSSKAPAQAAETSVDTINAVVVRSWNSCSTINLLWENLNATWSDYGDIPIHITYDFPGLCSGTVTYANLVASGADVVILSDPSGWFQEFSPDEISALQQYANEGHDLIGTFLLLEWGETDNRGLAPLFGLQAGLTYTMTLVPITPTYNFLEPGSSLYQHIAEPYVSQGYDSTQMPLSGIWDASALNGARIAGLNSDQNAAILSYHAPNYHATYITSMPEFNGSVADHQFFYNAIVYDDLEAVVVRSWSGCNSIDVIWDSLNSTWPSYGTIPLHIRYAAPGLCSGTISYAALAASGADVVIISDPSGGAGTYSPGEISALQQYAREGHNLIGTYLLLQFMDADNRGLAHLFGLQSGLTYEMVPVNPIYDFLEPDNLLFKNLAQPYTSSGYPYSQVPGAGAWDASALAGAKMVGITSDSLAAIMVYDGPNYNGIYISNMPEYQGDVADKQFFYNAITYYDLSVFLPLIKN